MNRIFLKRVYSDYSESDGYRILADRLWPRGISKEKAKIDKWAKDISPSSELRKEYHQELIDFSEFRIRYLLELDKNEKADDFISLIREKLEEGNISLLTAAKNESHNHLTVLKEWIDEKI